MRLFTPSFNLKIFFYFLLLFFLTKHTLNKNVSPINKKLNLDSLWYEKLAHARRPNPLRERNLKHDMLRFCTKFIFLCMFNKKQREAYHIIPMRCQLFFQELNNKNEKKKHRKQRRGNFEDCEVAKGLKQLRFHYRRDHQENKFMFLRCS